jgi:hypothetical protein
MNIIHKTKTLSWSSGSRRFWRIGTSGKIEIQRRWKGQEMRQRRRGIGNMILKTAILAKLFLEVKFPFLFIINAKTVF